MIKLRDWCFSSVDKYIRDDNLAFEVEIDGQTVPFYHYKDDGVFMSPCSPSGMDDYREGKEGTSRRLLKLVNEKLVKNNLLEDGYHYQLKDYYVRIFEITKVKNMCMNCSNTYAFGTDWDIRCEKGGLENRNDNFVGKYNRNCCDEYSFMR